MCEKLMLEEKVEGLCIIQGLLGKYGDRLQANILFCLKKSVEKPDNSL